MKRPYFRCFTDDLIAGTYMLTDKEFGQYWRLLCHQHQHDFITQRDFLAITKSRTMDGVSPRIIEKFATDENGNFFNERMRVEIGWCDDIRSRNSENANTRWKKQKPSQNQKNESLISLDINHGDGDGDGTRARGNATAMRPHRKKDDNGLDSKSLIDDVFKTATPHDRSVFDPSWQCWIDFKTQKRQKYVPIGERWALKRLYKLTNGDINRAVECIEYSIAQNYTGIFEPNTYSNGKNNQTSNGGKRSTEPSGDYSADKMRF